MKKIIAILLSLSILFMLTACGNDKKYTKNEEMQTENKTEEVSSTEEPSSDEADSTEPTSEETSTEAPEQPTQPTPKPTQHAEPKPTNPVETKPKFNPTVVFPGESFYIRKKLTEELEISFSQSVKSYNISGSTVIFTCQFGGATVYSYHSYTDEYGNVYTEKKQDSIAFDLAPYGTEYGLTASLNYNLYSSDGSLLKTGTANSSPLKCKLDPYNPNKAKYEIRVNIANPEEVSKIEIVQ